MDILCSPEFPFITETLLFAHRIGNQKCEVTSPLSQSTINPYLPNPGVEQWLCGSEDKRKRAVMFPVIHSQLAVEGLCFA